MMHIFKKIKNLRWSALLIAASIVLGSIFLALHYQKKITSANNHVLVSFRATTFLHDAQRHLRTQIQEWKNILLRGHNKEDYNLYFKQFNHASEQFGQSLLLLAETLEDAQRLDVALKKEIEAIVQAHIVLDRSYRSALHAHTLDGEAAHLKIDALVRGADRPLPPMIMALQQTLFAQSDAVQQKAYAELEDISSFLIGSIMLALLFLAYSQSLHNRMDKTTNLFEMIAQNAKDGIMVIENDEVVYLSPAYFNILQQETVGMPRESIANLIHKEDKQAVLELVDEAISLSKRDLTCTYRALHVEGYYCYKKDKITFEYDKDGILMRTYILSRDVTQEVEKEQRLKDSEEKYRTFVQLSSDMLFLKGPNFDYLIVNQNLANFFGKRPEDIIGKKDFDLMHYDAAQTCRASDMLALEAPEPTVSQEEHRGRVFETTKYPIVFHGTTCLAGVIRDITDQVKKQEQIQQLVLYDTLTLLPNRKLFMDRLEHAFVVFKKNHLFGGVVLLDVDNFKIINDTWGHEKGDMLLVEMGERISSVVQAESTVSRLGGDEFAVLLEELSGDALEAAKDIATIAEKIKMALQHPYLLGENEYLCTVSVGATVFNEAHPEASLFIKEAEIALYKAKEEGRNSIRLFESSMQEKLSLRYYLESALRNALKNKEFVLYFQPQVNTSMHVVGAEALIRWSHDLRVIPPSDFIPLLEETGLIMEVGEWVLREGIDVLERWSKDEKKKKWSLALNVSSRQFEEENFIPRLKSLLKGVSFDVGKLKLEITENLFLKDTQICAEKFKQLKEMGVGISLDDFGTGYSSLSYLKRIPITQLKIDQSFVRDIFDDTNDAQIIEMIIGVAKNMSIDLVAEGVENFKQFEWLALRGCEVFQGYYIDKPHRIEIFEKKWENFSV